MYYIEESFIERIPQAQEWLLREQGLAFPRDTLTIPDPTGSTEKKKGVPRNWHQRALPTSHTLRLLLLSTRNRTNFPLTVWLLRPNTGAILLCCASARSPQTGEPTAILLPINKTLACAFSVSKIWGRGGRGGGRDVWIKVSLLSRFLRCRGRQNSSEIRFELGFSTEELVEAFTRQRTNKPFRQ